MLIMATTLIPYCDFFMNTKAERNEKCQLVIAFKTLGTKSHGEVE